MIDARLLASDYLVVNVVLVIQHLQKTAAPPIQWHPSPQAEHEATSSVHEVFGTVAQPE